jgi:1,4-dihydroxy-6-naphthoate synthase
MSDEVCAAHIGLYVNRFSFELGAEGETAVAALLARAEAAGLIPPAQESLFLS